MARNESPTEGVTLTESEIAEDAAAEKKTRKPAGSNFTIDQLLGKLNPTVAAENDPIEVHRKQVASQVEDAVAAFAQSLVTIVQGTTDEDSVKAALVSLETVRLRAVKAAKGTSPAV